jgi:hypothetical protein
MSKKSLWSRFLTILRHNFLFLKIYLCSSSFRVGPFNRRFLDIQSDFAKIREIQNNMGTKKYN